MRKPTSSAIHWRRTPCRPIHARGLLGYRQPRCRSNRASALACLQRSMDCNSQCGLLLHANAASVTAILIESWLAWARSISNPFRGNKLHRVGFGVFWDKTSLKAVGQPRNAEWGRRPITTTRSSKVCVAAPTSAPFPPHPLTRAPGTWRFSSSEAPSSSDAEATHKLRHQHYTNLTQEIARMRLRVRKSVC